jgi:NAD(P)-dependent dehydrogenase (short-subunit alcohol dehydrogenase family)
MASDLAGKTYVITGANTGIGKITARELARRGARVILACRSEAKTRPVIEELRRQTGNDTIEFIELDLADLTSVRRCADQLNQRQIPIHGLVNNAGLSGHRGTTKDGFEVQFGTNHLGHYLFTRLLLPRLEASGPARIVNVASDSHYGAKRIDWDALRRSTRSRTGYPEYEVSKLANVLFTAELARRLEGKPVTTYAIHPGVVATDVWRRVPNPFRWLLKKFLATPEQGARSSIKVATAPELSAETGHYYGKEGSPKRPSRLARDEELARELWARSAEWTGLSA